jgi:YfiH family protein
MMRTTPYYSSNIIKAPHGFFGCIGGVSEGDFRSLNTDTNHGDKNSSVNQNRALISAEFASKPIVWLNQIHGNVIHVLDQAIEKPLTGDALIATKSGFLIAVQTADCVPVLLQGNLHVAAIHAGWRGLVQNIVKKTITLMMQMGNRHIQAAIGPHIHWSSYEVKEDVASQLSKWVVKKKDKLYLDLTRMTIAQLNAANQISVLENNTYCDSNFFSCRRSLHLGKNSFGRQCSLIGL